MSGITCKFGGTSLADVAAIQRAVEIIRANPERKYIVPSAPGKRSDDDRKITDLLYAWYNLAREGLDPSEPAGIITERFGELCQALNVKIDIAAHLKEIGENAARYDTPDYMASRGEYLNGQLVAVLLGATFVDPVDYIRFDEEGALDPVTYEALGQALKGKGLFVVPGFYGGVPDGSIKTFSRGGSDVTGSIVARASGSTLYENWTDVSGFCMTDPRLVPGAKRIETITYRELRELSYMGASVLHDEAIFPVREPGIPINIRNTKDPDNPGTMIVAQRKADQPVCGIAGRQGFSMINIEKTLMNKERGFGRRIMTILDEFNVSFEHIPTGIDTMSVIVKDEELAHHGPAILKRIENVCQPDKVTLQKGLAIIATVGQGMNHHIGVAARLCSAMAEAGVNLRVIDQGSSEMNIIIGVEEADLKTAVNALYGAFHEWI